MKKRLLATLLCLSVLLMACACAAETAVPPAVSQPESKEPAPQFTLSEVNAESSTTEEPAAPSETAPTESDPQGTISMEESEIELEPIQPVEPIQPIEPVLPEERETTLELVQEFTLGEDGIPFYLLYDSDPSYAQIFVPYDYMMDKNGQLYMYAENKIGSFDSDTILRVKDSNDTRSAYASSMLVLDGKIYVLYNDGTLSRFTLEGGLEYTVKLSVGEDDSLNLFSANGIPMVRAGSKIYDTNGKMSTLPFTLLKTNGTKSNILTVNGVQYTMENYPRILSALDGLLTVREFQIRRFKRRDEGRHTIDEAMIYQFDEAGNPVSRFKISEMSCPKDMPCEVVLGDAVCEWCSLSTVVIGKTVFEGVYKKNIFSGADGSLYIMLVYTDGAKLYRINPGYTDVDFTDLESLEDPYYSCINCQEAEGGSSSASALFAESSAETTSDEIVVPAHPSSSRERVLSRVNDMRFVKWTLLQGHLETRYRTVEENGVERTYSSVIPHEISQSEVGDELTGIPYCHGGLNGYDNISTTDFRYQRFEDLIAVEYSTGHWFTAGNIQHKGYFRRTIGVDCSGLTGSAYGHTQKLNVYHMDKYGHEVDDYSQLQRMDLLVYIPESGDGEHVMLFDSYDEETQIVTVIDCTGGSWTQEMIRLGIVRPNNKVEERYLPASYIDDYQKRTALYTFTTTATHHTYSCSHIDGDGNQCTPAVTEEHVWETPDSENPSVQYCKICNFCSQHTFTYTSISDTQHTKTCTECGYTVTESHGGPCNAISATQHVTLCMSCNHSVTASHSFTYTYDGPGHVATCTDCGYSINATHSLIADSYDANGHTLSCSCGYSVPGEHNFTYTTENLAKHRKTCSVCDYSELAPHLLSYSYDADGHWQECSLCSFETVSAAHNYVNSECTVCGRPQLIAMDIIAIPEEDEPLPVPEDQKATV